MAAACESVAQMQAKGAKRRLKTEQTVATEWPV